MNASHSFASENLFDNLRVNACSSTHWRMHQQKRECTKKPHCRLQAMHSLAVPAQRPTNPFYFFIITIALSPPNNQQVLFIFSSSPSPPTLITAQQPSNPFIFFPPYTTPIAQHHK